jgi:hypothetical protein
MKIKYTLIAALAIICSGTNYAQGATVTTDLGLLSNGTFSLPAITPIGNSGQLTDIITGILNPNSTVIFTFTFTDFIGNTLLDKANYDYKDSSTRYFGSSQSSSHGHTSSAGFTDITQNHHHHISPASSLVLTAANLSGSTGTATIINNSSTGVTDFFVSLFGKFGSFWGNGDCDEHGNPKGKITVSYVVSDPPSPVPLPASAMLFGIGLITLSSIGIVTRKREITSGL